MHREAWDFIDRVREHALGRRVLDLGSQDVNGSPRELFPTADRYVGVDIVAGPGVDVVADAKYWATDERFDTVICTEVLEHERRWPLIISTAALHLDRGGLLIITAAADGRAPHSARVGDHRDEVVPPLDGEFYENIDVTRLWDHLRARSLSVLVLEYVRSPGDVYALAVKL